MIQRAIKCSIFLSLFLLELSASAKPAVYSQDKLGIAVTPSHPSFTLQLKSNPTTGYSWFLREYHPLMLKPVRHVFQAAEAKKIVGAPGYELWTFTAKPEFFRVPQQTVIRFIYTRPWEGQDQSQQISFRISSL